MVAMAALALSAIIIWNAIALDEIYGLRWRNYIRSESRPFGVISSILSDRYPQPRVSQTVNSGVFQT